MISPKDALRQFLGRFGLTINRIHPRPMTGFLKKFFKNKELIGVEIGVLRGEHALEFFNNLKIRTLYLIDPYLEYEDYKETGENYRKQKALSNYEAIARKKLSNFRGRTRWIRKISSEASGDIKEKVDFVYIDGNHQYAYVKDDIEKYYKLLNKGGIIGGHDYGSYQDYANIDHEYGVVKAVDEFAKKMKKKVLFSDADWWIIK